MCSNCAHLTLTAIGSGSPPLPSLLVPNAVAVVATILLFAALEIQTRAVEEPYLSQVHGDAYRDYARHGGRFLPYVGRLR